MNKKNKMRIRILVRSAIQVFFFFAAPALFISAFSGLRYIFTQFGVSEPLELNSFVKTLIFVLIYTFVFGRFICGYACPFGAVQDWCYMLASFIKKKLGIKKLHRDRRGIKYLQYIKYFVLIAIMVMCFFGVFSEIQPYSPWNAFAQITGLGFRMTGLAVSLVLMIAALVGSAFYKRFFCQVLCPMGAVFALMPVMTFGRLKKNPEICNEGCRACRYNCPVNLDLEAEPARLGECISCGDCADICPKDNINYGLGKKGGKIVYAIIKAGVLYAGFLVMTYILV